MKEERRSVITDEPAIVASPFQLAGVLATNFGLDTGPGFVNLTPGLVIPTIRSHPGPKHRHPGPLADTSDRGIHYE